MQLRIRKWNKSENKNELLAVQNLNDSNISETFKILHFKVFIILSSQPLVLHFKKINMN